MSLSNLQKRLGLKSKIKGLKSKKSLLKTERLAAGKKRDWYWINQIDSDLAIVNEDLIEAEVDLKEKRYRK
jgi:fructose-specific component phosphotransferase system IIB-like protein